MNIEELRQYKFILEPPQFVNDNGIAIFDLIMTFAIAGLLYPFINKSINVPITSYLLILVPISLIFHIIFNVDTFLTKQLLYREFNIYHLIVMAMFIFSIYFYKQTQKIIKQIEREPPPPYALSL